MEKRSEIYVTKSLSSRHIKKIQPTAKAYSLPVPQIKLRKLLVPPIDYSKKNNGTERISKQ